MFVGKGRVLAFNENLFTPGKSHVVDVACDLWPTIVYEGEKGYKGLEVTVTTAPVDLSKVDAVSSSPISIPCFCLSITGILQCNEIGEEEYSRAI